MQRGILILGLSAALLSGCVASTKPTHQTTRTLTTYKISGVVYDTIADAVTTGLKETNADAVSIDRTFLPPTLPPQPGRLELKTPAMGSGLAALVEAQGQRLKVPSCSDAPYIATGADRSMSRFGEATGYYVCLWPYADGVNLDIYTSFEIQTGGLANLGADITRSIMGDSSQQIQKSVDAVIEKVKGTGAEVEKVGELKA